LLVEELLPKAPIRLSVQSFPRALRFLLDTWPAIKGKLFGIV